MLEIGKHIARAKEWGLGVTGTGSEQVAVLFEVTQGDPEIVGQTITWYGYFSELTWERTIESLRFCGWAGADLADLQGLDANEVQIVVEHEEGDDTKSYAKVRWVNRLGAGGLALKTQLDAQQAKAFAARMRGHILAFDQARGTKSPSAPPVRTTPRSGPQSPEPPPIEDDPRFAPPQRGGSRPPPAFSGPGPSEDDIPF